MKTRDLLRPWLLAALLPLFGCGSGPKPSPVPDRYESIGSLQLVTHTRHYRGPNDGGWRTTEHWSLQRNGEVVRIDTALGLFGDQPAMVTDINAVFLLAGVGSGTDLVVNVGDPNNTSAFHLVRQDAAAVSTALLCKSFGGDNAVAWIDGPNARRGAQGLYRGPQHATLGGGRLLALGNQCLYDVEAQRAYRLPELRGDVSIWASVAPLAVSPDGRSLARFGSRRQDGKDQTRIFVADLARGQWNELPVDPLRMRYPDHEQLDGAWLLHHFEWRRGADGSDRLVERASFRPLPFRGYYLTTFAEYRVARLRPGNGAMLGEFLVRRLQAVPLPPSPGYGDTPRYAVDGVPVHVAAAGFYVPSSFTDVPRATQMIHRVGDLFDQALATGRYDALFSQDAE